VSRRDRHRADDAPPRIRELPGTMRRAPDSAAGPPRGGMPALQGAPFRVPASPSPEEQMHVRQAGDVPKFSRALSCNPRNRSRVCTPRRHATKGGMLVRNPRFRSTATELPMAYRGPPP